MSASQLDQSSVYLPHVFTAIGKQQITDVFESQYIGRVGRIDFISKTDNKGKSYNAVYVHFKYWHDNETTQKMRKQLDSGENVNIYYDGKWFWTMMKNKSSVSKKKNNNNNNNNNPKKILENPAKQTKVQQQSVCSSSYDDDDDMNTEEMDDFVPQPDSSLVDEAYVQYQEHALAMVRNENSQLKIALNEQFEKNAILWDKNEELQNKLDRKNDRLLEIIQNSLEEGRRLGEK